MNMVATRENFKMRLTKSFFINILGTLEGAFSKGIKGSKSLNFAEAGGPNCNKICDLKGSVCYAEALQERYTNVQKNCIGKRLNLTIWLTYLVSVFFKIEKYLWIRFSVVGSLPEQENLNIEQVQLFKALAAKLNASGVPYHTPIESLAKLLFYKGLGFKNIRLSLGLSDRQAPAGILYSRVVNGDSKELRLIEANRLAAEVRAAGLGAVVCPAIRDQINKKTNHIKCGKCRACADPRVDAVFYCLHV